MTCNNSSFCCRTMCVALLLIFLPLTMYARRHVVISGLDSVPPMEFMGEDGVPQGFFIDVLSTAMERLGYDYTVRLCDTDELQHRFAAGEVDIVPSPLLNLPDTMQVSESNMLLLSYISLVSRISNNFIDMSELNGKRVAILKGTVTERYFETDTTVSPVLVYASNPEQAMRDVAEGRVDAFVTRTNMASYLVARMGIDGLALQPLNVPPVEQRVMTRDEGLSMEITGELMRMRRDGTYDSLYNKWLAEPDFYEKYFAILSVALVILLLLLAYVVTLLVRKIYKAHKLLQLERYRMAVLMDAGQFEGSEIDMKTMTFATLSPMGEVLSMHTVDEMLDMVHPKDRKIVAQNIENARNTNGAYGEFVARIEAPGGGYRYYMIYTRELRDSKGNVKLYWVKKDVNDSYSNSIELTRYHARMDMALKNTGILQWDYDVVRKQVTVRNARGVPDGTVVSLNDYLGHLPTLKFVFDIMDEGRIAEFVRDVAYVSPSSGEMRYATMMVRAIARDDDGRVVMYTGIRKDNTELIKIQKDLELARDKAEAADRLKSQFLDNMSHEIRTPLNAIVGFSSLLQDATDDERQQYVEIINRGSEQLLSLINDILEMSSIEAGTLDLCEEPFDLSEDFNAMAEAMQKKITEPGVELIVDNPYKSCIVTLDERRVNQIVRIFMTNAIKNTHKGHVKMSYNYVEGTGVTISVEDTGVGIDEENFGHVFRRFEKIDNFVQGSGLELAIVKAIADHTGNEVGFTSKKGVGSTFYFIAHCEAKVTV